MPELSLPADIVVEATSPDGAVVEYTASATDLVDAVVSVICSPVSGSTFPLGTTSVSCSATDTAGNIAEGSFNVTVQDTTAPETSIDSATDGNGADLFLDPTTVSDAITVTFSSSDVNDASKFECRVDQEPFSSCTDSITYSGLLSGSHVIEVRAIDEAGNPEPRRQLSFTGRFKQPLWPHSELAGTVKTYNLQEGIENSLDSKLESVLNALDDINANNDISGVNSLEAFINAVEAQRGKKITDDQADKLTADAQAIIDELMAEIYDW